MIVQVQTHVQCDRCGARAPAAAGITSARRMARDLGWRADGSRKPDLCANCIAIEEYNKLVHRIGPGFHPDTPFEDYDEALQLSMSGLYYTRTIDRVFKIDGVDPYGIALDIIHEITNSRAEPGIDYEPSACPMCGGTTPPSEHTECLRSLTDGSDVYPERREEE